MNEHGVVRARAKTALRAMLLLSVAAVAVAQQGARAPLTVIGITPSGTNVPAGRQLVLQFNRPVVPIGRMDRTAGEIPIETTPPLACQWRWLDTSALACQLADGDELTLATRYTVVVNEGIAAEDGATTSGVMRHEFTTERPRVSYPSFATWRSPGMPVIRAVFTQAVSESSVREHLFMRHAGAARLAVEVEPDTELREVPRYIRLPGERVFVDFGERQTRPVDDQPGTVAGETARRVWLVRPSMELPLDTRVELVVEPGLESGEGPERGDESRVAVEFHTFPEFAFLGVRCSTITHDELVLVNGGSSMGACNPLGGVGLEFSAPVPASEIKSHVEMVPDLAGGRTDYDPWANWRDYSQLGQPHERGRRYTIWLPERLQAAEPYRLRMASDASGLKDEFGRTLRAPVEFEFATSHRPPAYTLVHPTAVLEQGVDSEVPLYVTNLERYTLGYRSLTRAGARSGLVHARELPAIEDVQYGVPLGVREMLGADSGAIFGRLSTDPPVANARWQEPVFATVTPYQLHVKLGHFNSLVWVTDLATGAGVRSAAVTVYVDRLSELSERPQPLATATTDATGVATFSGTRELDPTLALLGYRCSAPPEDCPRLFVRVDGPSGMALLPLDYRFAVDSYRASRFTVFEQTQPRYGHLHSWGTTAQGVYRAGDTIEWKIYVRDQDNESLVAAPVGPYLLELVDPTGQVVHTVSGAMLSSFGALSGTYAIPKSAAVGWYQFRLTPQLDDSAPAPNRDGSEPIVRFPLRVLVSDFTPSPFGVRTTLNGDLFEAGQEVTAETRATLFSGG
ncbi:MAG TPA: MG2 domain-containing protein, partial [Gammaproteobacteria bacterium]